MVARSKQREVQRFRKYCKNNKLPHTRWRTAKDTHTVACAGGRPGRRTCTKGERKVQAREILGRLSKCRGWKMSAARWRGVKPSESAEVETIISVSESVRGAGPV